MLFHEGCDGITWNKKAPILLLFLQKRLYLCRRKSSKRCFRGVFKSQRTDGAARAEPNTFELCRTERAASAIESLLSFGRVAFEEDNKSVARDEDLGSKKRNKGNGFSPAKNKVHALSAYFCNLTSSSDVTIRDSLCKHGSPLTAPSVLRDN